MKDSEQQRKMLTEASSETTRSYVFKTNDLCVIAGTSQGVEQTLKFVKEEELNLKYIHNYAKIARYQKEMKTNGSHGNIQQNIELEEEEPSDDWSAANEGMEICVKFPSSTPIEIVKLYRNLDLQGREF